MMGGTSRNLLSRNPVGLASREAASPAKTRGSSAALFDACPSSRCISAPIYIDFDNWNMYAKGAVA